MRTIFKVALTELRTLFYSPVAWLLLVAFFIQCGIAYLDAVKVFADAQQRGGEELKYLGNLTFQVFSNPSAMSSLLPAVTKNLYLYIPLLTMGLLSREVSSGTIKLLYSSPIKASQVVLGKYLSMMLFGLLFVVMTGFFMISGMFHIRHADAGFLWPSAIGVYLLICAYSAIGLFMSSLTTYQIVAAAGSFAVFGLLNYIGNVWQGYDLLGDIAYYLSMNGRTQNFFMGLISSRDVIYFLVIICLFLGFTFCHISGQRSPASAFAKAGRYMLVLVCGIIIIYASSQPALSVYHDATRTKINTLTPNSQKVMAQLKGAPLEIISYNNVLSNDAFYGHPQFVKRTMSNWDRYVRFKPDTRLKMINYYDEPLDNPYNPFSKQYPGKTIKQVASQVALSFGVYPSDFVSPEELRKTVDLTPEMNRFVMQLKWKNRSTFLRIYNDIARWPSETEVLAAIKRLEMDHMPRFAFITGDLERSIQKPAERDYKTLANNKVFRYSLVNQGFDTDTLNLDLQAIPEHLTALIVADPRKELSTTALTKLRQYVEQGGNLLIAGEPGKQSVINPLLSTLGISMMEGVVAQPSNQFTPDLAIVRVTPAGAAFTAELGSAVRKDSLPVLMPGVTGLDDSHTSGFTVTPLLFTDSAISWIKKDKLVPDSAAVVFNTAAGDERKTVATTLALSRKINGRQQRIVVTADADFMSNANLSRYDAPNANFAFSMALFSWLDNGDFPIDTSRPDPTDTRMNLSVKSLATLKIIYTWVLPAILIAMGAILLIRRRRK